ncbi:MAG: hypothetical protein KF725_12850 [Cyclobacteriaceae bacterium]|nr:hypothetical protein [Cyclobacteriaceae bacterium]UYN85483.1 MAG: hypothetical protein KIT51_11365 [Cyclobacteriaceae bacterium]
MSITAAEWNVLAKWLFDSCTEEELTIVKQLFKKKPALQGDLEIVYGKIMVNYLPETFHENLYKKTISKLKNSAS